jgi:hypothetical protein
MTIQKVWTCYLVVSTPCMPVLSSHTFVCVHVCSLHGTLWKIWKHAAWSCPKTVSVHYNKCSGILVINPRIAVLSSWYWCCVCRDCETYFGRESLQPITRDDSVVCETQYSKVVPLEGGEVGDQSVYIIKIDTELWILTFSQLCNRGFLSPGMCFCITGKVVPDVLEAHVAFRMSELLTQWCSITSQRQEPSNAGFSRACHINLHLPIIFIWYLLLISMSFITLPYHSHHLCHWR